MDPLSLGLSLVNPVFGYLKSRQQKREAEELKPSTYIPAAQREAEALARVQSNATVAPGYSETIEKMKATSANSIDAVTRGASDAGQVTGAVAAIDKNDKQGIQDLNINNQMFRLQSRKELQRQLGIKAGYQHQNQMEYENAKAALMGASDQNAFNSVSKLGEVGQYYFDKNKTQS